MKLKKYFYICCLITATLFGAKPESVQESYSLLLKSVENNDWMGTISYATMLNKTYNDTAFAKETDYYLAMAFFNLKDLEFSDKHFSRYLKRNYNPKFFEEVLEYKFQIAESYREGAKKRLFGWKKGPKIVPAEEDAFKIYDEIVSSLPNHELAAKALFSKALLHIDYKEYKESIDCYEQIIKRFAKNDLAINSFVEISKTYLKQASPKQQNTDILELAEINAQKFKEKFPQEERVAEVEKDLLKMKEIFAQGLYEIGEFYEKDKKLEAASLYYLKIISSFPGTDAAKMARTHLDNLKKTA